MQLVRELACADGWASIVLTVLRDVAEGLRGAVQTILTHVETKSAPDAAAEAVSHMRGPFWCAGCGAFK